MIKFNFHFIDQWEGEEAFVQMDKILIWKESYAWCDKVMPWYCKKYGINSCGNDYPDRLSHPVIYVGKHESDAFTLTFATTLTKSPCVASWGIDDLQIYLA